MGGVPFPKSVRSGNGPGGRRGAAPFPERKNPKMRSPARRGRCPISESRAFRKWGGGRGRGHFRNARARKVKVGKAIRTPGCCLGCEKSPGGDSPHPRGDRSFVGGPLNCLSAWGCFIWCGSQKRDQKKNPAGIEPGPLNVPQKVTLGQREMQPQLRFSSLKRMPASGWYAVLSALQWKSWAVRCGWCTVSGNVEPSFVTLPFFTHCFVFWSCCSFVSLITSSQKSFWCDGKSSYLEPEGGRFEPMARTDRVLKVSHSGGLPVGSGRL